MRCVIVSSLRENAFHVHALRIVSSTCTSSIDDLVMLGCLSILVRRKSLKLEPASVMIAPQNLLTWFPQQVFPKCATWNHIVFKHKLSLPEFGNEQLYYVFE